MFKLLRRFVAYFIDLMVVMLIAQSLAGIPAINKQLDDYNKYYDDYMTLFESYGEFKVDLTNDFKDKKLSKKEYEALIKEHEDYKDVLENAYVDNKITKKEYDKINKQIDKEYKNEYEEIYFNIEKNSVVYFSLYIIVVFLYFVFFNKYTNGQTLGKKLTRLKIVNIRDKEKMVPVWSYIVRAIILYQPINFMVKLIGAQVMGIDTYYMVTNVLYNIQSYLEILVIGMIIVRLDGRGLHDMLAGTRVILIDKNGDEVEDKFNSMISKKIEDKINRNKKIIDEEPSE